MQTSEAIRFLQAEVSRLRDENRELKDELTVLRSSVRALSALQDILQRLGPSTDLITLLHDLLASALAVVGAKDGSLLLVDEETGDLVFAVVLGEARERLAGYHLPPGQGSIFSGIGLPSGVSFCGPSCSSRAANVASSDAFT